MKLERMRLIDMSWHWSSGTHTQYQSKINTIRTFEHEFGISVLPVPRLPSPPTSPDIPLMWCMEAQSTRPGRKEKHISHTTVRQLRSAASQFFQWSALVSHPNSSWLNKEKRLLYQPCRPTDSAAFSIFFTGLSSRMGDLTNPSHALLERHVREVGLYLNHIYKTATDPIVRREAALGGLANLLLWLGWLRSMECFTLTWEDVDSIHHSRSAKYELPTGVGFLELRLAPETKSNRTKRVDVVIAHLSGSGFQPARWFRRARSQSPGSSCTSLIFTDAAGAPWTSQFFRQQFLYPVLRRLKNAGDPSLTRLEIELAFWSLHCYRRGARSHVSHHLPGRRTKATKEQVYEHGRWRYNTRNLPIDMVYLQWSYKDRLKLSRLFM